MRAPTAPATDTSEQHQATATVHQSPAPGAVADPYRPALTGLRALAVAAIVLTATADDWLPGGAFVGIEIFFVLSGSLTAAMMTRDPASSAVASAIRVLARRARRLLPALLTVLGGASILALAVRPDELLRLAPGLRATLLGIGNWQQIADTGADAAPMVLDHLWPLGVGVQVTVAVVLVLAVAATPRARAVVRLLAVVLGIASIMALILGVDGTTVSDRIAYGTDTRAGGLLLGVALGLSIPLGSPVEQRAPQRRRLGLLAAGALLALVVAALTGGGATWVGRGGPLLVDLSAVLLVAALLRGAPIDRALGAVGLQWLGLRAYAAYLWHWPVLLALGGPEVVGGPGATILFVLMVAVLADLTYRFVEVPLGAAWHVSGSGRVGRPGVAVAIAAIACGAACAAALVPVSP